jgi:hypothetical protein
MMSALVIVGGWSVRQSIRAERLVPITDKGLNALVPGNHPYANGTYNAPLTGIGRPAGLEFIRAEPKRAVQLVGRKFLYFWGVLRDGWNVPRPAAVWIARASGGALPLEIILPVVRGGWLLLLVLVACARLTSHQWRDWWLLPAVVAAVMAAHLVTLSSYRFAVPILPVAYVLVADIVARVVESFGRRWMFAATAVVLAVVAMQMARWPVTYRVKASEMDGVRADNRVDADNRTIRFADRERGRRPVLILNDEYLPKGNFVVRARIRREAGVVPPGTPVAHVSVVAPGRGVACNADLTIEQVAIADRWTDVTVPCALERDGLASLSIETLGRIDLAFSDVAFQWR